MNRLPREVWLLVLFGAGVHVLLSSAIDRLSAAILPTSMEEASSHWFALYATPWLYLCQALAPGLIVGMLARRRPMLCGFLAVFLGQIILSAAFNTNWDPPIDPFIIVLLLESGLVWAPLGLVSAAAGFQTRQHAFQPAVPGDGPRAARSARP